MVRFLIFSSDLGQIISERSGLPVVLNAQTTQQRANAASGGIAVRQPGVPPSQVWSAPATTLSSVRLFLIVSQALHDSKIMLAVFPSMGWWPERPSPLS